MSWEASVLIHLVAIIGGILSGVHYWRITGETKSIQNPRRKHDRDSLRIPGRRH